MTRRNGIELPHNDEAEGALLGAMILAPEIIPQAVQLVSPVAYYASRAQAVHSAIQRLGEKTDLVTLRNVLQAEGKLDDVDAVYLVSLPAMCPTAENWRYYAEIVLRCYSQRLAIDAARQIAQLARDVTSDDEMRQALGKASLLLENVQGAMHGAVQVSRLGARFGAALDAYDRVRSTGVGMPLPYGIAELDEALGGQYAGQMVVIVGATKIGKSSWCQSLCEAAARTRGPALLCSNEMLVADTADRALQMHTGIPLARLRTGNMSQDEWTAVTRAAAELSELPMFSADNVKTLGQVWDAIGGVREQTKQPLSWIGVDWLQRMEAPEVRDDREVAQLDRVLNGLKEVALRCEVPVVVVSQYRRSRDGEEHTIHDIRGTGMAEILADSVIQLERDTSKHARTVADPKIGWRVIFKVGAARHGVSTKAWRWFDAQRLTFVGPSKPDEEAVPPTDEPPPLPTDPMAPPF
jgi:replicative DNA helicase